LFILQSDEPGFSKESREVIAAALAAACIN